LSLKIELLVLLLNYGAPKSKFAISPLSVTQLRVLNVIFLANYLCHYFQSNPYYYITLGLRQTTDIIAWHCAVKF